MSTAGQETLNWSRDRRPRSRALSVSWFFLPLTRVKRVRTFIFFGERQLSDKLTVLYCEEVVVGIFIRFSCERKLTLGAFRLYGDVNLEILFSQRMELALFSFQIHGSLGGEGATAFYSGAKFVGFGLSYEQEAQSCFPLPLKVIEDL